MALKPTLYFRIPSYGNAVSPEYHFDQRQAASPQPDLPPLNSHPTAGLPITFNFIW